MINTSIRKILLPLTGHANDELSLATGLALGKSMPAHVEGFYVRPDPVHTIIDMWSGLEEIDQKYLQYTEEVEGKAAGKARMEFNNACMQYAVPQSERPTGKKSASSCWREVVGWPEIEIAKAARFNDLTVFAGPLENYHRLNPNVLEHTLLESGRPILFSRDGQFDFPPESVTIAWDGGIQITRAIYAAYPFLERADRIDVVSVEGSFDESPDPGMLTEYLAWHGITCRNNLIKMNDREVADVLLEETDKNQADLLVMGGYAHSRFKEIVFGGTTLHALRHASLSILMMH